MRNQFYFSFRWLFGIKMIDTSVSEINTSRDQVALCVFLIFDLHALPPSFLWLPIHHVINVKMSSELSQVGYSSEQCVF